VTGARSGIGLHTAVALARAGWKVYAGLRDPSSGAELAAHAAGLAVLPIGLDVTQATERERAMADVLAVDGRIDLLVNNAGVGLDGPLELLEETQIRELFDVNLIGAWGMTKAVLPAMRAARRGTILMVSSVSGRLAMPAMGAYAASKFALEGMSEAWRHELAPHGVRLALIEPGPYRTDLWRKAALPKAWDRGPYGSLVRRFRALQAAVLARAGDPQEVAALVVKLAAMTDPPLRTAIGPTARLRTTLRRVLADAALERLVSVAARGRGRP
jgi:NAD(P)-dependent dehydrogenase (short-subunit alcohol dehydrogenase family)